MSANKQGTNGANPMEPGAALYPRNQWYVAATSDEVTRTPLSRKLLDKPVLLYRQEDGTPVALFDRCPHRGYPLSAGKLVGNNIQCGYHGLEFGPDGSCQHIPSGGDMPPGLGVTHYPLVEQWQWLWIWMGDPELADESLIPDLEAYGFGREGWHSETSVMLELGANYLMPIENLLDATHITFLHTGVLDTGDVASQPLKMQLKDDQVTVARHIENELQSPLTMRTFGFNGDRANRTITAESLPPALCGIRIEIEPIEKSDVMQQTNQLLVAITPQDSSNTLEFTAVAQTFPFYNDTRHDDLKKLLMEDVVAMERIQQLFNTLPPEDRAEFGLSADRGIYQARRIIAAKVRKEQTTSEKIPA